jgi:hypothetical protein
MTALWSAAARRRFCGQSYATAQFVPSQIYWSVILSPRSSRTKDLSHCVLFHISSYFTALRLPISDRYLPIALKLFLRNCQLSTGNCQLLP